MSIKFETVETVSDFILGGSKITADGDCSHEIKKKNWKSKMTMVWYDSENIQIIAHRSCSQGLWLDLNAAVYIQFIFSSKERNRKYSD